MARSYTTGDKVSNTVFALAGSSTYTMSAWLFAPPSQTTAYGSVVVISTAFGVWLKSSGKMAYYADTTHSLDPAATTISASTWNHIALVNDQAGVAQGYVNGSTDGASFGHGTAGSMSTVSTGSDSIETLNTGGRTADVAIWNVALTSREIFALSQGVRPTQIRPASLLIYWPLDGLKSPEPDFSGNARNGTVAGAVLAAGPPTALLTRRVFLPFSGAAVGPPIAKYDWPLTVLPIQPSRSFVQATDLSALAGAGAKPFAKQDWPLTLLPPPDRSYVQGIDLSPLAGAGARPFAKNDWPGTLLPPPDRSYMEAPDLARMAGAGAKPFAKYDWPLSVLPVQPDRSFVWPSDIVAYLAKFPFAKYDWPLTQLAPPDRSYVQPSDLSALALAGAKPFAKYDWPLSVLPVLNPPGFMQAVDLSALANAGLVPFAKYDWPQSVPPVLNPPGYTWSTSGPLIPQLGFGKRKPLFIASASGFPASYWPDGS